RDTRHCVRPCLSNVSRRPGFQQPLSGTAGWLKYGAVAPLLQDWAFMVETVAIITPCYKAERWIGAAVRSVLGQTYPHWEHWIIADDGADYEALLAAEGLRDPRLRFLSSGAVGGGASRARNAALDVLTAPFVAILDADDRFKPDKLEQAVAALAHHAIVSVALDEYDQTGHHLRLVGQGPDRELTP